MRLKECPFCGGQAELIVRNPKRYGATGAYVQCKICGARSRWSRINETTMTNDTLSTPITEESIENGRKNAAKCWNSRARVRK